MVIFFSLIFFAVQGSICCRCVISFIQITLVYWISKTYMSELPLHSFRVTDRVWQIPWIVRLYRWCFMCHILIKMLNLISLTTPSPLMGHFGWFYSPCFPTLLKVPSKKEKKTCGGWKLIISDKSTTIVYYIRGHYILNILNEEKDVMV